MKKILSVFGILLFSTIYAQDTTKIWINTFGELAPIESAPFYRLGWWESDVWKTEEYYRYGVLYRTGQYTNSTSQTRTGTFITYYKDSTVAERASFASNQAVGVYEAFYKDGHLKTSGTYSSDEKVVVEEYEDYYREPEFYSSFGDEYDGIKVDEWQYYHPNGALSGIEKFDSLGQLLSYKYFDEEGNEVPYGAYVDRPAEFPGGVNGLMRFLGDNIQFPKEDKDEGRSGEVVISFLVNHDGKVKEPRIEEPQSLSMNSECIRLINSMPNWIPRREQNRFVETRYRLPIRFTNVSARGQRWMRQNARE